MVNRQTDVKLLIECDPENAGFFDGYNNKFEPKIEVMIPKEYVKKLNELYKYSPDKSTELWEKDVIFNESTKDK